MLVLTRLTDQAVQIFHEGKLLGTVKIVSVSGKDKVRLGFDHFPHTTTIIREEIDYGSFRRGNNGAARGTPESV